MKYPTTKIVIVTAVGSLLATVLATGAEINPNFDDRWTSANNDPMKAQLAIPYAQPQAKALEILRGRTVAEDDESCPVFNLTPESYNPCKGEPK